MGNTPHTAFRLTDETRTQLAAIADQYETTLTDAVRKATAAFSAMVATTKKAQARESGRYPFEAYTAALGGYRSAMQLKPGEILDQEHSNAIDSAVMAAIPFIREEQHDNTLRDVIQRLKGFGVDADVIQHFHALLGEPENN